jgi:predicted nuclease of restriction endonuclease-like RecB superfamily
VRFSLQDIKKQVQRRENKLSVSLHFLRSGELRTEIDRLVAYHEQLLDHPQRKYSIDEARACIGDYRLAQCLISTLSAWYRWQQRDWQAVVQQLGNEIFERFEEADITSSVHLRLALYNFVNDRFDGFLDAQTRSTALDEFAKYFCGTHQQGKSLLTIRDLDYLLVLDSDDEAVLVRDTPGVPSAEEVTTLYNQWVFEAALFNASDVHFAIDCDAFSKMQESSASKTTTGIGAVIKRLCYLARKFGVYYDLEYDSDSMVNHLSPLILHLTLYGPQEMTGAPQQYGLRLARLCRVLLGYSSPAQAGRRRPSTITNLPASAILQAVATIHFLQRSYRFVMDSTLLKLLPSTSVSSTYETRASSIDAPASSGDLVYNQQVREAVSPYNAASTIYDSSIEQSFAEAFQSLAMSDGADGWQLEREPEPLLMSHSSSEISPVVSQSIFIPDFAFTRGDQHIYLEILGFWTPAYRERKIAKLQLLKDRNDLLLAIPGEARDAYASIAYDFPIVYYSNQLSATEVLRVLRSHYDDVVLRLSQIDVADVRESIRNMQLLPERDCYTLLHCYRRSELIQAAERITDRGIAFVPGIGFYLVDSLEQLRGSFVEWLGQLLRKNHTDIADDIKLKNKVALPLDWVMSESRLCWPILDTCEDSAIEAIFSLWPEIYINRISIFEATISLFDRDSTPLSFQETQPKKVLKGQKKTAQKRKIPETHQADLWN